jgi:hypothetical protein
LLTAILQSSPPGRSLEVTSHKIPDVYTARLGHHMVRYANVHPRDMLNHLVVTYRTLKPGDLVANMERIQTPWNPDTSIEHVFIHGAACRHFASEGGNSISDAAYMQIIITTF